MSWSHHPIFSKRAKDYQAKTGESQAAISRKLGINLHTYRNYVYGSKKPGIKVLKSAARLFGCPITDFIDDPGAPPPCNKISWVSSTESDRALCLAVLEDIRSLSDREKRAYFEISKLGIFKSLAREKARASR